VFDELVFVMLPPPHPAAIATKAHKQIPQNHLLNFMTKIPFLLDSPEAPGDLTEPCPYKPRSLLKVVFRNSRIFNAMTVHYIPDALETPLAPDKRRPLRFVPGNARDTWPYFSFGSD
jgi:hypothetical protein